MPKKLTIKSAQDKAIATGFLDMMGNVGAKPVTLNAIAESLAYVAGVYVDKLTKQLVAKEADSSGALADSIDALDVQVFGQVYSVSIQANKYAKFIDEGVSGWAKSQGSPYQFKTKGVDPNGAMVKSIKSWLLREGDFSKVKNRPVSAKESKRQSITDASTKAAITTAFMIKRQGIKATHFWRDATLQMDEVVRKEFSAALRVDIIQNLTGQ